MGHVDVGEMRALATYAERAARTTESSLGPEERYLLAELAWLDGLLAVASGDLPGLQEPGARIQGAGDWILQRLARSLAALELALSGEPHVAADSIYALEMLVPPEEPPMLWTSAIFEEMPVNQAVNRLAAGRWLLAAGDTLRAEELLSWQEVFHPPAIKVNGIVAGLARLELARIEEARGNWIAAGDLYRWFLRADPIDDYADLAAEAREAVERLDGVLETSDAVGT